MTSSSSFLLRIDLAFSNKNFGKEPSRAAFVVFVIGILIKLWLLLWRQEIIGSHSVSKYCETIANSQSFKNVVLIYVIFSKHLK
jgi:hypothetical protein